VKPLPDRLHLVAATRLEPKPAAVDLDELDLCGHQHADWGCRGVSHLDTRPDGGLIRREIGRQRVNAGPLDKRDHLSRGEDRRHLGRGIEELRLGRHGKRLADPDRFRMAQTGR
jgi:hypothetical protein